MTHERETLAVIEALRPTLRPEIIEAADQPDRDYVAMTTQYAGVGAATVIAAREIPALGIVTALISVGILASKGVAAYYGDRSKIPEVIAVAVVVLSLLTLGFADKFNRPPSSSHVPIHKAK
jgi:hypothetical protein